MLWFSFALLTALFNATEAAVVKGCLKDLDLFETAAYPLAYSLPFFVIGMCFVPTPHLEPGFWQTLFLLLPINLIGYFCYLWGVKEGQLSLSVPFMAVTPAVVLLTGYLFLDELPNLWGGLGVLVIVAGSYMINIQQWNARALLAPFKSILSEKGTVLVLIAATIFGLASVMGKKMIVLSSPMYAAMLFFCIQNVVAVAILLAAGKVTPRAFQRNIRSGVLISCIFFGHIFCHFFSISLINAAYMIAIKRLSCLFSVLYGALWFKETHFATRLGGAGLMCVGAAFIALGG